MTADAGLDAGLLIGTQEVLRGAKRLAWPQAPREVQKRSGLLGAVGVTRKAPVLVPPRFDGIRLQHAPYRAPTHRFAQRFAGPCGDVGQGLATQRLLGFRDQCTGDRLDQRVIQRGTIRLAAPSWLVVEGTVSLGPTVAPPLHRAQRQSHTLRCLDMGQKRWLIQKQNQGSPRAPLILHGPVPYNLCSLFQESRWKFRAGAREGTTPGRPPLAKAISATIAMPPIVATTRARKP
jgi:hypothetical protein